MLSRYSARIDEVVAAHLWIEARGVNWRTGRAVAANVLMNTRKGVLRDLGIPSRHQKDWAWSLVTLVDQMDLVPAVAPASPDSSNEHVYDLLSRGRELGSAERP